MNTLFRRLKIRDLLSLIIIFTIFIVICCHYNSNQKPNYQRRRLKWVVYDEYDELASAERIIIEPQTDLNRSNDQNGPIESLDGSTKPEISESDTQDDDSSKSLYIDHPWASDDQDFTAESKRFLNLIKPVNDATHCSEKIEYEKSICCLSDNLYEGVIYSFNLDQNADVSFEKKLSSYSNMNQIFIFNPNYSAEKVFQNQQSAAMKNLQNDENDSSDAFNFFKIALDTQSSQKINRKWRRKTLQEIKVDQNHTSLNLVKINMNSSEWKILRQWLEFGEISQIDQLIVKIHLHWSGFGINGKNNEIVHQWYNTISSIIESGLRLVSSVPDEGPKVFLSQNDLFDTSCCYYLTFFRHK